MGYESKTEEPIVVTPAKELDVKDFNKKEVEKISKDTTLGLLKNLKLIQEGTIEFLDNEVTNTSYMADITKAFFDDDGNSKENIDGLYLFTCGNSYAFIPITSKAVNAELPIRVPFTFIASDGGTSIGNIKLVCLFGTSSKYTHDYYAITGKSYSNVELPDGWGYKLFKVE